jgi:glycosyltransferase involved in cell wall biosynthesis
MKVTPQYFDEVSLLVTHYNRSKSLERLLYQLEVLGLVFKEIVVSDDSSSIDHLEYLKNLQENYNFTLVRGPTNRGLGNNLNKGQDAVRTPYTLYIQEDFIPQDEFAQSFKDALSLLNERKDFDMARFYAYKEYPYLKNYKYGFSEMLYKWWYPGLGKFAYYSDHPHLRRSSFFDKFGRYPEGISGDKTEFKMMMSVLRNNGKFFFYKKYKSLLEQANSSSEPSTMSRNIWRQSDNFMIGWIRTIYRYLNYYISLYLIRA